MKKEKIRSGNVYAYWDAELQKYGIIQVIKESMSGYHIRVFYHLHADISKSKVSELVNSHDFYYLANFFSFFITDQEKKVLGRFPLPDFVNIPKYRRTCERKRNGNLVWYVRDKTTGMVVKTYKKFNDCLKELSPDESWFLESITNLWREGFTLENWHILEENWYQEELEEQEREKLSQPKYDIKELKEQKPTVLWEERNKEFNENNEEDRKAIKEIERLLDMLITAVEKPNATAKEVNKAVKGLVVGTNKVNAKSNIIETEEREELDQYVCKLIRTLDISAEIEDYDELRDW